jgi:hypothetical protein
MTQQLVWGNTIYIIVSMKSEVLAGLGLHESEN